MTLATILVLLLLTPGSSGFAAHDQSAPAPQTPPAQSPQPPAAPLPPAKTAPGHPAHANKTKKSDCSTSTSTKSADAKKPCPPKKVVVENGGSAEPTVQLKGDTPSADTPNERLNTEQLRLATESNLQKIEGRQLTANQQETVNQIKQFMNESKAAVGEGDLERGHSLALKARLLSDELLNP